MTCDVISNVQNKYLFGKEETYGDIPLSPTQLDMGHVQSISLDEDEGTEPVDSMNSGHTAFDFEDNLYNVSGQIVTKITKAALPNILEALYGSYSDDGSDYTVITSPVCSDDLSYFMKFNTTNGKTKKLTGIGFTAGEFAVEKDGSIEATLTYQAQVLLPETETLDPVTTTGALFMGLDASVTYNGNTTILNNFTFSLDWNFEIDDSRGIEVASPNGRRVINRIVRNNLTVAGSFESHMDDNIDTGYLDERTSVDIALTLERGTANAHVFSFIKSRTSTRSRELNNDNTSKTINCDFMATDTSVTGDL